MEARRLSPADRSSAEAVQQQLQHSSKVVDVQRFALMGDRLEIRGRERYGNMELTFAMVCLCDPIAQGCARTLATYNKQLGDRFGDKLVTASL